MSSAVSVALGVGVSVVLAAVGATAIRHRRAPGAVPFAVLAFALSLFPAIGSVGQFSANSAHFAFGLLSLVWRILAVVWLWFALEYTGRGPTITWRGAAAGAVAALTPQLVAIVAASLGTFDSESVFGFFLTIGWNAVYVLYILGIGLIVQSRGAADDHPVERTVALVTVGGVTMLLLSAFSLSSVPDSTRWWLLLAALGTIAGAFVVATWRGALGDAPSAGHLARELVLDEMTEAAVAVDQQDRVLDANQAAEATFAFQRASILGQSVESVIGFDPIERTHPGDPEPVGVDTPDGTRQFAVTATAIRDRTNATVGRVYLFRDVTESVTDEQRLAVLNRVLRHNLRNDLDAIRAFAESIETGAGDADAAERIRAIATDLSETGTTVDEIERLFSGSRSAEKLVAVDSVVRSVARAVEADCDGAVTTSNPAESAHVRTDPELLERALHEVVENGLEHADQANPVVDVAVETADRSVAVVVRDGGPGIPDQERAVLLEGDETPLRHGTGLGLWFVHWAVTRIGGELSFSDTETGGSVVTIRLPDRTGA